jgi:hypothetical protein
LKKIIFIFFTFTIFILSTGFSLYITELILIFNSDKSKIAEIDFNEVSSKIRNKNINSEEKFYPYLASCNYVNDGLKNVHKNLANELNIYPLTLLNNSNIIWGNEGEEWSEFKTDRYGFRNFDSMWDKSSANYFFGDSYSNSAHVSEENSIHSKILDRNINVISMGGGCWAPPEYYAIKKEMIAALERKIIPEPLTLNLLYYLGNDYNHPIIDYDKNILSNYFLDDKYIQDIFSDSYFNKIKILHDLGLDEILSNKNKNFISPYQLFMRPFKLINIRMIFKNIFYKKDINLNLYGEFVDHKNDNFQKIKKYIVKDIKISHEICAKYDCKINVFALATYKDFFGLNENQKRPSYYFEFISMYNEFNETKYEKIKLFPNGKIGHYSINGYDLLSKVMSQQMM